MYTRISPVHSTLTAICRQPVEHGMHVGIASIGLDHSR